MNDAAPSSGLAKYTVDRVGGLYSWVIDGVKFFDQEGGDDAFEYEFSCPHDGRGRSPTLAKVLTWWKELVESGVWRVGGMVLRMRNVGSAHLRLNW